MRHPSSTVTSVVLYPRSRSASSPARTRVRLLADTNSGRSCTALAELRYRACDAFFDAASVYAMASSMHHMRTPIASNMRSHCHVGRAEGDPTPVVNE